jgi:hypothetical protein
MAQCHASVLSCPLRCDSSITREALSFEINIPDCNSIASPHQDIPLSKSPEFTGIIATLIQRGFEAMVGLFHIKRQLSSLILSKLFCRSHLVEGDEPLYYLSPMVEVPVRHLIY